VPWRYVWELSLDLAELLSDLVARPFDAAFATSALTPELEVAPDQVELWAGLIT
jgi:hypothetical protein